ncbi:MAG: protein kinase [Planctomycetota bacterium]|nr:protein kinase [Planctomycetota bacterium]
MTDDPTMPLPKPPGEDPGETLRPAKPVTPSNETVPLSGGGASSPATDPTLIGDAERSHAAQDGRAQARKLGPYALVRPLGRGGMGAVWEALDTRLNRRVAVKVMVAGEHASAQDTERFRREAQNSAKLRHPNIVPVHDFGIEAGQQYLVMDLVDGVMLADALRQRQFTYREKAILLEKVARAVHYAHEQGVIHRDLKPSNVMLEFAKGGSSSGEVKPGSSTNVALPVNERALGEPLVMDFGLAKDIAKDSSLSQSGQVMGTPAYMPPEQAEGRVKDVGPRSDVYSMGAILYEMLTGRVPFTGENAMQVLRATCHDDPVPPRRITPDVPRDLETVCLKCLEKELAKRYASAQALADDLARWLNGEPVAARPASPTERLAKWVRRRPAAAALVGVSTLAVVLLIAGLSWGLARERDRMRTESGLRQAAEDRRRDAEAAAKRAEQEAEKALKAQRETEYETYPVKIRLARERLEAYDVDAATAILESCPRHLRHWEWGRLKYLCRSVVQLRAETQRVDTGAISPNGKRVATVNEKGTVRCWDARTGAQTAEFKDPYRGNDVLAFSPDGQFLAVSASGQVGVWNTDTGKQVVVLPEHAATVTCMVFAPDGQRLVTVCEGSGPVICDAQTGKQLMALWSSVGTPAAAFSQDGSRILGGRSDYTAVIWDGKTGKALLKLAGHTARVTCVAMSPDGRHAATGSEDRTCIVWDAETGRQLSSFIGHRAGVSWIAFLDDRCVCSAGTDNTFCAWDARHSREMASVRTLAGGGWSRQAMSADGTRALYNWRAYGRPKSPVIADAMVFPRTVTTRVFGTHEYTDPFSNNGQLALALGAAPNVLVLKETVTGKDVTTMAGHTAAIVSAVFSPDDGRVVTGSDDKTARIWEARTGKELHVLAGHGASVCARFIADGRHVLTYSNDSKNFTVKVWDADTGQETSNYQLAISSDIAVPRYLALTTDGTRCAVPRREGLAIIDTKNGKELRLLPKVHFGCFVGTQRWLARDRDGAALWSLEWGGPLMRREGWFTLGDVTVSRDGKRFALWSTQDDLVVARADDGKEICTARVPFVSPARLSPDGKRLVVAKTLESMEIAVLDTETGREVFSFASPGGWFQCWFSAGGKQLIYWSYCVFNESGRVVTECRVIPFPALGWE